MEIQPSLPAREARASAAPGPAPRRVLVIDHDEAFLRAIGSLLGACGFAVESARQGFLATHLAMRWRPEALLLGLRMPGVDGYEVLSLIRRRSETRALPVVACTSLRGAGVEDRIRAAGFDGYLGKPVEPRAVIETLARLVR